MEFILELKNYSLSIKNQRILNNISLQLKKGMITGMIGGSGSGKTTLIKSILNIQLPENVQTEGEIFIKNEKVSEKNRKLIQLVFQEPASFFNPRWNLQECLEEALILSNINENKIDRIKKALNDFSMSEKYLSQSIRLFSGGELQRISLIRAILCNPEIILMDEPVSGLDPLIQREVIELIRNLGKSKNISIFLISHDIDFIAQLCEYVYVIHNGEIVENNTMENLIQNPRHDYTKLLLQSRDLSNLKN